MKILPVRGVVSVLILFFVTRESDLRRRFARLAGGLTPSGMLWVAWPKRASGVDTDLGFDRTIR